MWPRNSLENMFLWSAGDVFWSRSPLKRRSLISERLTWLKNILKNVCVQKLPCSFCFILFLTCVRHSCVVLLLPVALKPCLKPFSFLLFVVMDLLNSTQLCLIQLYVVCSYKLLKKTKLYFEDKIILKKKMLL